MANKKTQTCFSVNFTVTHVKIYTAQTEAFVLQINNLLNIFCSLTLQHIQLLRWNANTNFLPPQLLMYCNIPRHGSAQIVHIASEFVKGRRAKQIYELSELKQQLELAAHS